MDFLSGYDDDYDSESEAPQPTYEGMEEAVAEEDGQPSSSSQPPLAVSKETVNSTKEDNFDGNDSSDDEFGPKPASSHAYNSSSSSSPSSSPVPPVDMDTYIETNKIPLTKEISLAGANKAVTCVSVEPSGKSISENPRLIHKHIVSQH
ncbi:hypothetical protein EON63_05825 [archaeon]|nr:MAG: hypothetical protein EON63_05825 [archaeon]